MSTCVLLTRCLLVAFLCVVVLFKAVILLVYFIVNVPLCRVFSRFGFPWCFSIGFLPKLLVTYAYRVTLDGKLRTECGL